MVGTERGRTMCGPGVLWCLASMGRYEGCGGQRRVHAHVALPLPCSPPSLCCPAGSCGSMAHKTKDCMERPRQKGARFTNKNIAADEKVGGVLKGQAGKTEMAHSYVARGGTAASDSQARYPLHSHNTHMSAPQVEDIELVGFDAKRDRWNGYNPDEWTKQAERCGAGGAILGAVV